MEYLKLFRVKHYIKNLLVFLPLVFGGALMNWGVLSKTIFAFIAFSFLSSVIYIINDIQDVDKDRNHPTKKNRPIASGAISVRKATISATVLLLIAFGINFGVAGFNWKIWGVFVLYLIINLLYSVAGLKNYPLIDVSLLVAGFVLRVIYGSTVSGFSISSWLYLVIICGAFYLGFGKRRNENSSESRAVLKYYTSAFLDKSMYSCMTLAITFYSLWCMERNNDTYLINYLITVPIVMLIVFKYNMNIEGDSDGDPVNVILGDHILLLLVLIYMIVILFNLYF